MAYPARLAVNRVRSRPGASNGWSRRLAAGRLKQKRAMAYPARLAAVAVVVTLLAACTGSPDRDDAVAGACLDGSTATAPSGPAPLPVQTLSLLGSDEAEPTACWVGTPLVVNFWAEWCEPCKAEMPDFEQVHQAVGDQVRFIGVDYEDRVAAALAFADEVGVTYHLVEDPDGAFFDAVHARGAPTTLLVDAAGSVVHHQAGPLTRDSLQELLATELGIEAR